MHAAPTAKSWTCFHVLGLVLAAGACVQLVWCVAAIFWPGDLTFPENSVVVAASEVASGRPLYADWREWPHRFFPYGPATIALPSALAALLGRASDLAFLYGVGRFQSLAALAAMALAVFSMARTLGYAKNVSAVVGCATLLVWPYLPATCVHFRPDAPAAACSLWAVALSLSGRLKRGWLLALVAIAFKPSAVLGLAICAMQHGRVKGWKTGAAATAMALGVIAVGAWVLYAVTTGKAYQNVVTGSAMGASLDTYRFLGRQLRRAVLGDVLGWDTLLLLIAGLVYSMYVVVRPGASPRWSLACAVLASAVLSAMIALKVGAGPNYFLEYSALVPLALATALGDESLAFRVRRVGAMAAIALAAMLSARAVPLAVTQLRATQLDLLSPVLSLPPGSLLADLAYTSADPAAHALNDSMPYAVMAEGGKVSTLPFEQRLKERQFPAIAVSGNLEGVLRQRIGGKLWATLSDNYETSSTTAYYKIMVPKR